MFTCNTLEIIPNRFFFPFVMALFIVVIANLSPSLIPPLEKKISGISIWSFHFFVYNLKKYTRKTTNTTTCCWKAVNQNVQIPFDFSSCFHSEGQRSARRAAGHLGADQAEWDPVDASRIRGRRSKRITRRERGDVHQSHDSSVLRRWGKGREPRLLWLVKCPFCVLLAVSFLTDVNLLTRKCGENHPNNVKRLELRFPGPPRPVPPSLLFVTDQRAHRFLPVSQRQKVFGLETHFKTTVCFASARRSDFKARYLTHHAGGKK